MLKEIGAWMDSAFLSVFGNAIWVGAAAMAVYLGIKNELKEMRKDLATIQRENMEAHKRHEDDLADHEERLRLVERIRG